MLLPEAFVIKTKNQQPLLVLAENKSSEEMIKIQIKAVKDYPDAFKEVKKSIILIASQFEFTMAPYPGQITEATNCGNKFKPKLINSNSLSYVAAFSNERLALSICEGDFYKYKTITSFFINESNTQLLVVDYYSKGEVRDNDGARFLSLKFKNYKNINLDNLDILIR